MSKIELHFVLDLKYKALFQTNENEIDASKEIGDEIKDKNQTEADLPYHEPWNRTQPTLTLLMWIFAWLF